MSGQIISYQACGRVFEGVLVGPSLAKEAPGVLMVPNWWGVTENAVARGERFAAMGYHVLVVDIFGVGKRPANINEAATQADIIRSQPLVTRAIMAEAAKTLQSEAGQRVAGPLSSVGFCLGGGIALEHARSGADLAAAASIHGDLVTLLPADKGCVRASVLALHGSVDPISPKAHRDAFEIEMTEAEVDWNLMVFGGRLHAFTDVGVENEVAKHDSFAERWSYALADQFIKDALTRRVLG